MIPTKFLLSPGDKDSNLGINHPRKKTGPVMQIENETPHSEKAMTKIGISDNLTCM